MWKNNEIEENHYYNFDKLTFFNGMGWFIDFNYSVLCKIDIQNGTIEQVWHIPAKYDVRFSYRKIAVYKDRLIFIPYNSEKILIYYPQTGDTDEIVLSKNYSDNGMKMLFVNGYVYMDKIILVPARYKAFAIVDINTKSVSYNTDWLKYIDDKKFNNKRNYFATELACFNNILYIPFWQKNSLLKFDLLTNIFSELKITDDNTGFSTVCVNDESFVLCEKINMRVIVCDYNGNVNRIFNLDSNANNFLQCLRKVEDKYIAVPCIGNQIFEFDWNTGCVNDIYKIVDRKDILNKQSDISFWGYEICKNKLYVNSIKENKLLIIDLENYHVDYYSMKMNNDNFEIINKNVINYMGSICHEVLRENEAFTLQRFLGVINNKQ